MSYFATIRCPNCGKESQLHLGGYGFITEGKQHCSYCGHEYDAQANCIECEKDRDYDPIITKKAESDIVKENKELREENAKLRELLQSALSRKNRENMENFGFDSERKKE